MPYRLVGVEETVIGTDEILQPDCETWECINLHKDEWLSEAGYPVRRWESEIEEWEKE